jgi:branched-chain amino acid transport system permease protein
MNLRLVRGRAADVLFFAGIAVAVVLLVKEALTTPGHWSLFFQLAVAGVTLGSVYALIALGYSMVYGILKLLNFAHGDVYMVGAFIGFGVLQRSAAASTRSCRSAPARRADVRVAMLGCGLLGVVIERFAYRPLRDAPRIAPLISALGVSFFLRTARSSCSARSSGLRHVRPDRRQALRRLHIGRLHISLAQIITIVAAIVADGLLTLLVRGRGLGKAMRATSFDREAAR